MKKKDQIKQLTRERDHARALACEYERIISAYRQIELEPVFDEETFLRRARIVMDEPK